MVNSPLTTTIMMTTTTTNTITSTTATIAPTTIPIIAPVERPPTNVTVSYTHAWNENNNYNVHCLPVESVGDGVGVGEDEGTGEGVVLRVTTARKWFS